MQSNQNQDFPVYIIETMAPSYKRWTQDGVSPFMFNLEFNNMGELHTRRGTEEIYNIKTIDPTYIKTLAADSTQVLTEGSSLGDNIIIDVGVVAYLTSTGATKYFIFTTPDTFTVTQSSFSIVEETSPQYEPYPTEELGIQLATVAGEKNILYILSNRQEPDTTNTDGFNILNCKFTFDTTDKSKLTIDIKIDTDIKIASANVANRRLTQQRAFTVGVNRILVGEGNVLYLAKAVTVGTVAKELDEYFPFKDTDVIVKIIEFDNNFFVITNNSIYKGQVSSDGTLNFTTISNNILALNAPSIVVVGNFCYIPVLGGSIFKLNIKSANLQVDSYTDKIGEQIVSLIKQAYPKQSFYDTYNSTLNFIYMGNIKAATSLITPYKRRLDISNQGTIQSILLSKHYVSSVGDLERWTSIMLDEDDISAGMSFTSKITSISLPSRNDFTNRTLQNPSCERMPLDRVSYDSVTQPTILVDRKIHAPQTILINGIYGSVLRMNPHLRLDKGSPFMVGVVCPFSIQSLEAQAQNNVASSAILEVKISTDSLQSTGIFPDKKYSKENYVIMNTYIFTFTGDLSEEPKLYGSYESKLISQDKSVIMNIRTKINTHLPHSGVMCIFKSNDIRTFFNYKVDS